MVRGVSGAEAYPLEGVAEVLEIHDCMEIGGRATQDDYKEVIGRKRLEPVFQTKSRITFHVNADI
jgi:hypothetical protein